MQVKELFDEIIKDDVIINNSTLSKDKIDRVTFDSKINDNHIYILKLILTSIENNVPSGTIYKNIKKHFELS